MMGKTDLQRELEMKMQSLRPQIQDTLAKLFNEENSDLNVYGPVRYCVEALRVGTNASVEHCLVRDDRMDARRFDDSGGLYTVADLRERTPREMGSIFNLAKESELDEKWDFFSSLDKAENISRTLPANQWEPQTIWFITFAVKTEMCMFVCDFVNKMAMAFETNPEKDYVFSYANGMQEAVRSIQCELSGLRFPDNLFEVTTQISSLPYESRIGNGSICVYRDRPDCDVPFDYAIAFDVDNVRHIRKLLEMAGSGYALQSYLPEGQLNEKVLRVVGLGKQDDGQAIARIAINGHMSWMLTLLRGEERDKELVYHHGMHHANKRSRGSGLLESRLNEMAREGSYGDSTAVMNIVRKAEKQKHGALLIVVDDENAKNEAERLCKMNRGILIDRNRRETLNLSTVEGQVLVKGLTSIDGAIIVNLAGECYAIGVILDGVSIEKGNPARGSRYNSAKNYVRWRTDYTDEKARKLNCIAVVISEDKTLDVFSSFDN